MNTPVAALLARKNSGVVTVGPSDSVADAVRVMNQRKIGSVIVTEGERLVGIFTERDVLSRVVAAGRDPHRTSVHMVMTGAVERVSPQTTLGEVMDIFTVRRCRHLPVVFNGSLVGLVSIGDVSRWMADMHRTEAEHLRQYIAGDYPS